MSGLRIKEGPGPLEFTQQIRELITRLQVSFDPSISLMPNMRRRCWMIVQDLRRVCPRIPPDKVYRADVMLIGGQPQDFPYIEPGRMVPYKHLFDFILDGQAFAPSYEYILMAIDDANPRGDDPELERKLKVSKDLFDARVEKEDHEDTAELREELDKYLTIDGVAAGRGLRHFTFSK